MIEAAAVSFVVGWVSYFLFKRWFHPDKLVKENRELRRKIKTAECSAEDQSYQITYLRQSLKAAEEKRDQYRRMAESHEVKYPKPRDREWHEVWEGRVYQGLPSDNLNALEADLQKFKGSEVTLTLNVHGILEPWRMVIGNRWVVRKKVWDETIREYVHKETPVTFIGPFNYQGPVDRVLNEVKAFLHTETSGLYQKGKWVVSDCPLKFEIDLSVEEDLTQSLPQVQIVEVAVVEERFVEKVIEKPVLVDSLEKPPVQTREDLVDLIEAVLEVRGTPSFKQEEVEKQNS